MRALLSLLLVLTSSCAGTLERHPRLFIVTGTSAATSLVVGLPLTTGCTPGPDRDCGARHDALIYGGAAIGGAILGLWIAHQWISARRERAVAIAAAPMRGLARGVGERATCLQARADVVARLEARCRRRGKPGVATSTVAIAACTCTHDAETSVDTCTAVGLGTCEP